MIYFFEFSCLHKHGLRTMPDTSREELENRLEQLETAHQGDLLALEETMDLLMRTDKKRNRVPEKAAELQGVMQDLEQRLEETKSRINGREPELRAARQALEGQG